MDAKDAKEIGNGITGDMQRSSEISRSL